jgi:lipopolysaccharide/colanic/teichoic acid biosynthesis glycosyltransferase
MSAYTRLPASPFDLAPRPAAFDSPGDALADDGMIDWTPSLAARSWIKRAIDVIASGLGLCLLAPVLLVVAALIRLDSRGPILFRQPRMGLGGRVFSCLKFRTMVVDAEARLKELEKRNEAAGGVLFKIKDDPRITRLGRFLRKSSIDELPQLWNVFRGEMSLVGPRPLQLRDSERLARMDRDGYQQRLSVVPGITGPWQVGGRSDVDSLGMLKLDLDYVNRWSVGSDIAILGKTVGVVLAGKGAC